MFTIFDWVNLLSLLWDEYISSCPRVDDSIRSLRFFKNEHIQDMYILLLSRYRSLNHLTDYLILNKETRTYRDSLLVASNMYLLLGVRLSLFTPQEIHSSFAAKSSYIQDGDIELNEVFTAFVHRYLKVSLQELLPFVQYSSLFYNVALGPETSSPAKHANFANVGY